MVVLRETLLSLDYYHPAMAAESRAKAVILDQDQRISAAQLASMVGLWATGEGPLYRQLARAVEQLIERGAVRNGDLLPPERKLAAELDVARGTIVGAYTALAETGVVARTQGSGTRVTTAPAIEGHGNARIGDALFDSAPAAIDLLTAVPQVLPRVLELANEVDLTAHRHLLDDSEPAGVVAPPGADCGPDDS